MVIAVGVIYSTSQRRMPLLPFNDSIVRALGQSLDRYLEKGSAGLLLLSIAAAVAQLPDDELSTESLLAAIEGKAQTLEQFHLTGALAEFRSELQGWILTVRSIQKISEDPPITKPFG